EINDRDIRTLFGEKNRDRTTNSTIAAGDQRDFVPKFPVARVIADSGTGLWPHFVLATRLFSLVLGWANFLFLRHTKKIFAAREWLSRAPLRKRPATTKKSRENPRNRVDGGLTRVNFLIPLKRGTPLIRRSFYVHLGLQIGLNFVPATIPGKPWIEGRGDKIEFFCRLKWTSGLVL